MKRIFRGLRLLLMAASPALADESEQLLMQQASGTAVSPDGHAAPIVSTNMAGWNLMFHGSAFVVQRSQTGPRGRDAAFSANSGMLMATRPIGKGAFMFRTMLSLEPATMNDRRYPLLFQTGETAYGRPIVDGQHPHDFFMELAFEYARPVARNLFGFIYVAPVGEPALGPVAFPHRQSASEIPQAVLSHHYQDSTHIAFSVATLGLRHRFWQVEGSTFRGAEPDEQRWDIEGGRPDSWAARISVTPIPSVAAQVSTGYLKAPEATHPGDARRTTVSISHSLPLRQGLVATTVAWGRHYKEVTDGHLEGLLAETLVHFANRHWLNLRWEKTERDELFPHLDPPIVVRPAPPFRAFDVQALTAGYTLDLLRRRTWAAGVGVNYTWHRIPPALEPFYGESPNATSLFVRIRPIAAATSGHGHHAH
jgi:hypothetical protein